jgi:hypothetical protein
MQADKRTLIWWTQTQNSLNHFYGGAPTGNHFDANNNDSYLVLFHKTVYSMAGFYGHILLIF